MPRHNQGPYLSEDRNAHGFYEIRWTENGRSKRKSTGEGDYRKAQRIYAEFLLALDEVSAPAAQSVLVQEVIDGYLAARTDVMDLASQEVTFGHLGSHFGQLAVTEIEDDDVAAYIDARAQGLISFVDKEGRVRGGLKAGSSTCRRELGMLSTAIGWACGAKTFKGRLKPGDKPPIELPDKPPPRDRWLSRDEARAFLQGCLEEPEEGGRLPRVYRYAAMLLFAAPRRETVFTLDWPRILVGQGLVNFQAPGRRVTKKRRGWVPIGTELRPILERAEREKINDWYLDAPHPPYHAWRRVVARTGIQCSPHVLRHTWATWAAQDGVPLLHIAGVLHDTLATVEKNYLHHCPDHLRGAVDRPILIEGGRDVRAA